MSNIRIEWLSDSYSCELCGTSYADGAIVYLDNEKILDLLPSAHCYGCVNYDTVEVFAKILHHLGYTFEEKGDSEL